MLLRFVSLSSLIMILGGSTASAQEYPNKSIRIVTGSAGGGIDFVSRLIAQDMTSSLGQPVVVDNRNANAAAEFVAKSPPDGYTLSAAGANVWLLQLMQNNVPWDVLRDFASVTALTSSPNILVVHPSLPVKSVRELIALAKARPGAINYAAGVAGSSSQLTGELFKSMAHIAIVHVPYGTNSQQQVDLLSGQVQLTFASPTQYTPYVKSGRLRALAVTSAQPSPLAPDLPTVAASGVPGYEAVQLLVMFAPAKTPAAVIDRLNREVVRVLQTQDAKQRLFNTALEPVPSTPAELTARIKSEMDKWGKLIKDAGIHAE